MNVCVCVCTMYVCVSFYAELDKEHTHVHDVNVFDPKPFTRCLWWIPTHAQNRVMEAGSAESGVDSFEPPAAAEMNGRAENCLHS